VLSDLGKRINSLAQRIWRKLSRLSEVAKQVSLTQVLGSTCVNIPGLSTYGEMCYSCSGDVRLIMVCSLTLEGAAETVDLYLMHPGLHAGVGGAGTGVGDMKLRRWN